MKSKYTILSIFICLLFIPLIVPAQVVDTTFAKKQLNYIDFIQQVKNNNLEYAAQKYTVNLAEAEVENAKIIPDVEWNIEGNSNQKHMGNNLETSLGWTIELGRKRKARIDLAKSQVDLNRYLLQDYLRNLYADASLQFLECIQNKNLLDVQLNSYKTLSNLAASDSIRYKLGDITLTDSKQSKLEAQFMLNEVFKAESEWKNSLYALNLVMGKSQKDTLYTANSNFTDFTRDFDLADLITTAQNNRADLQAALQNKEVSQKMLKLAKANRVMDLGISAGMQFNGKATNEEAPSPYHTGVTAGLSIPLRFLNNRKGEVQTAHYTIQQADLEYKQVELQIQTEVTQAYQNYVNTKKQMQQFSNGLLSESKAILEGKIYSYKRGNTSLLEVLDAQRTYNDVQENYYQTLYNFCSALVRLERTVGIWDINF
ncbi:TolC family protein [Apibacter sp. B3889]|uniref:TolC family protein n=1 Tax=unclassified Apibacter TaxID=2630820 RepID=UPI0013286A0D|nr:MULTISPECIES: TolC family protein [unclassified Apibacter]MXO34293.1 TolC family protein [Apibacter sp. B3883]MXO41576.1 TolC family protein [Apibacter sp. B3889]MXP03146.1 TolC family protein [Apibacter sp. B3887]MXP07591.1 TolC family protein [Apibacter sp. B3935]